MKPVEQVPTHPPLAIIEVLSPEDRVSRYQQRLDDYRRMGVKKSGSSIRKRSVAMTAPIRLDEKQSFSIEISPLPHWTLATIFADL